MQTILFLDGENFIKKIRTVFEAEKKQKPQLNTYNFKGLLDKVLKDIKIDKTIFYFVIFRGLDITMILTLKNCGPRTLF